jgi:ABC-2 type transport system ATP-binding protein
LSHSPELLILDEPMSGLDPFGRRDVRELILEQRERGVTVMLSSHILPDVEMLCDRVGVVLGGRLVRTGTVNDLVASQQQRVEIRCVGAPIVEVPARWRERVTRLELPEGTTFVIDDARDLNDVLAWLVGAGIAVRAVTPQRSSLEDFFLSVAESVAEGRGGRRLA